MARRRATILSWRGAALLVLALMLAGCGFTGGSPEVGSGGARVAGVAVTPTKSNLVKLTNENWDLAVQDTDRYHGSPVDINGQIFNALGDYEGASHYQMFTDPKTRAGNTHLALPLGLLKLREGDNVHVVGTLDHTLVTSSRGGNELRLPYVVATSLEVLSGPSGRRVVLAPEAPTAEPTAPPTAAPPTPAELPATETPAPPSPTATEALTPTVAAVLTPTATTVLTATEPPAPAPTSSPSPTAAGPLGAELPLTSFAPSPDLVATADPSAPLGLYYASAKSGRDWNRQPPIPDVGSASVTIDVPKAGRYAIWVRMQYQSIEANSWWLVVDNQRAILLGNDDAGYGVWKWVGWQDGSPGNRVNVDLSAGQHTLTIVSREPGTRFDDLLITADLNYKPANPAAPPGATPSPSATPPPATATPTFPPALTPTQVLSATPTASPSPVPTTAPSATAPAHASAAVSTATATNAPRATNTAVPTNTARPTNTAVPTSTARPTNTTTPSNTPAPTNTPPPTKTATPAPTTANPATQSGSYTVQPGDTLSAIAGRVYGDPSQYQRIFEANRDQLSSPDRIKPGQQLRIPR